MTQRDGDAATEGIDGMAVEDAVAVVTARSDGPDPEEARSVLAGVAADGVVSREGIDDTMARVSKVVSTAETRTELAAMALDDAREAAAPVADLDAVAARLDRFERRLTAVEEHAAALTDDVQAILDSRGESADLYETAAAVRQLERDATGVQQTADELQVDLESFEEWLADPATRVRALREDVDALGEAVENLESAVDRLADAADEHPDADDRAAAGDEDLGVAWFDATLHHGGLALQVEDVRAELDALREWAARDGDGETDEGDADSDRDDVAARLADLDDRLATVRSRLDDLARPAWRERFGERLAAYESDIAEFEPPVEWGAVEAVLAEYRPATERANAD